MNERGHLIGGLFYEVQPEARTAHMDKVVVADDFQGQGIAGALIEELCNRLRTAGFKSSPPVSSVHSSSTATVSPWNADTPVSCVR